MEFLSFFVLLFATVLFAAAFRRFHLPWVLALITVGIVLGPRGFGLLELTPTLSFLSEVGLIFLMFMAGLETRFDSFRRLGKDITIMAALNGLIPLVAGIAVGFAFDLPLIASLLIGIIFMSSSIAVIIPTLESLNLTKRKLGRSIIAATMVVDILSLVLLSILLQSVDPTTALPLPSFYILLAIILTAFYYGLPKIRALIPRRRDEKDLFESEARIIFALLIGVVATFELLGLHPIIAGFFAGLVLSDSIRSELLVDKLHTLSYGIFIPVFFVVIGMETDLVVLTEGSGVLWLVAAIVTTSVLAKFGSGWLGGRLTGLSGREASLFGLATIPQLSTTLAVVFTGVETGLLPASLMTAMVTLSIVTVLIAPLGMRYVAERHL